MPQTQQNIENNLRRRARKKGGGALKQRTDKYYIQLDAGKTLGVFLLTPNVKIILMKNRPFWDENVIELRLSAERNRGN